ncbi:hypothetical protein LEL_08972 [Akanthomyces lecanii RCEF 1005]|uniref:Uncharacterized protein n=1 Tax=Akanthomyces lecanii RCEF 1005 TaxID=1081108 RepID=A0A168CSK7_CORDF|nr:hypothetical protein LEL_08972 [Akanthomyces lecanii RCEF 1005]
MEPNTTSDSFQGTPAQADVPPLDHESASLSGSSPATIHSPPPGTIIAGLNPQAPWFDLGPPASLDTTLLCASPPPPQDFFGSFGSFSSIGSPAPVHFGDFSSPPPPPALPFPGSMVQFDGLAGGAATTDDLKLLLLGISARLDALERSIAGAGVQWCRVERDVAELRAKPSAEAAVDSLKKSLKEFTAALVLQVLGGEVPEESGDTLMVSSG